MTFKARCDFCGSAFLAVAWNQRTCVGCAAKGAPDQSAEDPHYHKKLRLWSEQHRAPESLELSRKMRARKLGIPHKPTKSARRPAKAISSAP